MTTYATINDFQFFLGGNAYFTIDNGKDHYTFRISKKEESPYFVGILAGPDNHTDYKYIGLFDKESGKLRLTQKSKFNDGSLPVKVFNWALKMVKEGKELPYGYNIQHDGCCCRCGRKLTDPVSISLGIGPTCRS